ncbi:hypothetical protein TeGR_g5774 [Tetraparma gracilis]|uniref:GAF domain-containing protein n=1 Tax=Tetraparma gracilis TaxID=2962635 RepID=A0ABQ6N220_9STRA|nr:hypothetical protein TeGR_g5774 [Tetraparma gracilis]
MGNTSGRGKSKSLGPSIDVLMKDVSIHHMATLLEMMKRINTEKTLESAIHRTIESATVLLNCDRATMFIVDEIRDELVVRDASGSTVDIRIPMTAGIAGNVYSSGEVLNIPDAYSDSRFNKQVDVDTGYKTTSMLTTPVYDAEGNTLAVLQAINKKKDDGTHVAFGSEDETLIDYMAGQLGVILLNAKIYDDSVKAKAKVDSMLDIIRSIHGDLGVSSLCFILTERVPALVEADRCTLYLVDDKHSELWTLAGGVQIRMPKGTGIAGIAATEGEIVNIPDAYKDERFGGAEFDKKNNYHTKSILCLPIKEADGKVVAVLQLINKASGPFTDADQDLLEGFLGVVAGIIVSSQLFAMSSGRERKGTEFADLDQNAAHAEKKFQAMSAFAEDEEEEEEDE